MTNQDRVLKQMVDVENQMDCFMRGQMDGMLAEEVWVQVRTLISGEVYNQVVEMVRDQIKLKIKVV